MASIRIKVGAALDANVHTIFAPLESAAKRARETIDAEMKKGGKSLGGPYRTNGKVAVDAVDGIGKAAKKTAGSIGQLADGSKAKFEALAKSAGKLSPELASVAREAERELAKIDRAAARTALGLSNVGRDASGRFTGGGGGGGRGGAIRVGNGAAISVGRAAAVGVGLTRSAIGFARSSASALGVETDFGSLIGKSQGLDARAVDLSNASYMPGQAGANGKRVNAADLTAQVRSTAMSTGMSNEDIMGGLQGFVGKTGDLEAARATLTDLAKLSKATGTSMEDMSNAAADVSNQLGDVPDKGELINHIMKTVAGQGKLGAVEIKDMAVQMAKLASAAGGFEGTKEHNIATMGALAQAARLHGGATSAAMASTSVAGFVGNLTKDAQVKKLHAANIDVFTDDTHTKKRDAEEIILSALKATNGDQGKLSKLFGSRTDQRVVGGFTGIFNAAGGGEKGAQAVNEEFKRLRDTMMKQGDVDASFAAALNTSQSKVQVFNNQLEALAAESKGQLMPALMSIAPVALAATAGLIKLTGGIANGLASILGITDANQDKSAGEAERTAMNVHSATIHGVEATTASNLTPEMQMEAVEKNRKDAEPLLAKNQEAQDALAKEVAAQQARVAKEGGSETGFGKYYAAMSDKQLLAQVQGRDEGAAAYSSDKKKLAGMQETLATMQSDRDQLLQGLLAGTLKVKVVGGSLTQKPAKANPSGTMSSDTPEPE